MVNLNQIKINIFPRIDSTYIIKLLSLIVIFKTYLYQNPIRIPFLDFISFLGEGEDLLWISRGLVYVGVLIIWIKTFDRLGAFLIACSLGLTILSCQPCYSDSRFFFLGLFFLYACAPSKYRKNLLRLQVVILYFGSGLNKLLDPDWISGRYLDHMLAYKMKMLSYIEIAGLFPELLFSKFLSISVISIELSLSIIFWFKKYFHWGIWFGFLLHASSMIFINSIFGSFIIGVYVSYLLFIPSSEIHRKVAIEQLISWKKWRSNVYFSFPSHLIFIGFMLFPWYSFTWVKGVVIIIILLFLNPIMHKFSPITDRLDSI